MYLSLQQKSSFGTYFLFTFMKFIPVSRSPTNTENGTPGSHALVPQKCPKKTTCDVKSVIHAVTPFWPMYYIILSSSYSCLKKASMSSSSSWFWILTFDSKSYSALQWKLFGQICISVMLWRNWWIFDWVGNVWQNSHWEQKIFSLSLTMFDFNDFYLTAIKLRVYSKNSLKIKVRFKVHKIDSTLQVEKNMWKTIIIFKSLWKIPKMRGKLS